MTLKIYQPATQQTSCERCGRCAIYHYCVIMDSWWTVAVGLRFCTGWKIADNVYAGHHIHCYCTSECTVYFEIVLQLCCYLLWYDRDVVMMWIVIPLVWNQSLAGSVVDVAWFFDCVFWVYWFFLGCLRFGLFGYFAKWLASGTVSKIWFGIELTYVICLRTRLWTFFYLINCEHILQTCD